MFKPSEGYQPSEGLTPIFGEIAIYILQHHYLLTDFEFCK